MATAETFSCLVVRRNETDEVTAAPESKTIDDLPGGEVLIKVEYSSLNYKDALACQAHPGVASDLPHVPGIDAAGVVAKSADPDFKPGDAVLVTGYDLGTSHWGGYSRYIRVPASWVVLMPTSLNARDAMIYGTAGFTAAQCVAAVEHHGIQPGEGEVLVTGASGGVGSLSVAMLAKLGYTVVAATGKTHQHDMLTKLGAAKIIGREQVNNSSDRPLLRAGWSAAVDTVGGNTLSTVLRSTQHRGCIAACGLAGGHDLPLTVYPFILRGVTLAGIDSAKCPRGSRLKIWEHLAKQWRIDYPQDAVHEIELADVPVRANEMLAGKTSGRTLVKLSRHKDA